MDAAWPQRCNVDQQLFAYQVLRSGIWREGHARREGGREESGHSPHCLSSIVAMLWRRSLSRLEKTMTMARRMPSEVPHTYCFNSKVSVVALFAFADQVADHGERHHDGGSMRIGRQCWVAKGLFHAS